MSKPSQDDFIADDTRLTGERDTHAATVTALTSERDALKAERTSSLPRAATSSGVCPPNWPSTGSERRESPLPPALEPRICLPSNLPITIPPELKRDVLLRTAMRAFRNRILPIMAFARKFESTPLEGSERIRVPYFPLVPGASTDFVPANGDDTVNNQALQSKDVTVNKRNHRAVEVSSAD